MMNIFKPSEPKVTEVKSPEPNLDRNYFDELKLLKQKAIEQLIDRKKRITCDIQNQIEELQVKLKAELADIHAKLKELGHITESTTVSSSKLLRSRKFHPSVSDEELKQKFSTLLSGSKKAGSKEIFAALDISRPRFIAFQKNTGFLEITGSKKSTLYSLKG